MNDTAPNGSAEPAFRGIVMPTQGQLRLLNISLDSENRPTVDGYDIRWDIWPLWLKVAEAERDAALAEGFANPGVDGQPAFGESLAVETQHGMASICASAFALEAFTNSVIHHKRKTAVHVAPGQRLAAASRIHQIWIRAFRLGNEVSSNCRVTLGQVFRFRNAAVHAPAEFNAPAMHPRYPVAVDPRFVMFAAGNATASAQFTRDIVRHLAQRPRPGNEEWISWCAAIVETTPHSGASVPTS